MEEEKKKIEQGDVAAEISLLEFGLETNMQAFWFFDIFLSQIA